MGFWPSPAGGESAPAYRIGGVGEHLLQLEHRELGRFVVGQLLHVAGEGSGGHEDEDRMPAGLVEVEEVAAGVGRWGDDAEELDVRPEDGVEAESYLVLVPDSDVRDGRALPLRQLRFEPDRVDFQDPHRNGDYDGVGHEDLPAFNSEQDLVTAPDNTFDPADRDASR